MAKVEIIESLFKQIEKRFKGEAHKVIDLIESLEKNPKKGKNIANVGGMLIKEIKYKNFRFFFITDGYKYKCIDLDKLTDIIFRFVRMADKDQQQVVIDEMKKILLMIGPDGL